MAGARTSIKDAAHRTAADADIRAAAKDGVGDAAEDASRDVLHLRVWSARRPQGSMGLTAYLLSPIILGDPDRLPL
jgi:hypothetical protein